MKQKLLTVAIAGALISLGVFGAVTSSDASGSGSDHHGIPDDNPVHHPDDGDGVCEKHETVIKTTPSGNRVNVPCHAGNHGKDDDDNADSEDGDDGHPGNGHGNDKDD
ncbi:MAG TPA: hypothetical protein VIH21_03190 [Dehalococcoidia bacterium]